MRELRHFAVAYFTALTLAGCADLAREEMEAVSYVDINEFMGTWYVIASIPTFLEKGALNPIEKYSLNDDGTVATEFSYLTPNDGQQKSFSSKAFIQKDTGNAIWGMQFVWPIKADYRIVFLSSDSRIVVVARNKRDFLWIMSRDQQISEIQLENLIKFSSDLGYDREKIEISNWQRALREVR
tara:strand:- start:32 stop:580 length:549 start_codon:yes stop_codon:yes gene_type:complete